MDDAPRKPKVLVVDDDPDSAFLLAQMLRQQGYAHLRAASAEQAESLLGTEPCEVVITDIVLPGRSGLDLLRWVHFNVAGCEVIMLTGQPEVQTAIQALREGAADYLTKPLTGSLLAGALRRVETRLQQAQQRRQALHLLQAGLRQFTADPASPAGYDPPAQPARHFQIGPVLLDLDRFVIEVGGTPVPATPTEVEILHYLCRHRNRVITAQELVQSIRGYQVDMQQAPEIIRPHISNLRRKLIAISDEADIVRTVRGVGYMLREA